ncbi:MAG: phosphoglycerate kinase [Alphaproteobacteria bacterium]|jgi:phosphoglycerate kinase|nr:phosphoglycerate kinase [Alphaproteobacteria bacterium]
MSKFVTLDDVSVAGKRVLIRVDLNVPMKDGKITSFERIIRSAPTVKELSDKGAKVIVLSHLGRPQGTGYEEEFTLKPIAAALADALSKPVGFVSDCVGDIPKQAISQMKDGDIIMLENVRFYKAESKNDIEFTKQLAELGDLYVSDAFSAAHRAHSSTEGLAHLLPYAAGRLMEAELDALEKALGNPATPVVAIVGGAKVSTKLDVLNNLVKKVQYVIIGGGMANTFLYAMGHNIGTSLAEKEMVEQCNTIMKNAAAHNSQLVLPIDAVVADKFSNDANTKICSIKEIPDDYMILDAGPKSVENFIESVLKQSKTLIWNGPLGAFEMPNFAKGTRALAEFVAEATVAGNLVSIAGGGDTVAALDEFGLADKLTYISTAGGAFLEWMEGKELPGVVALLKK